MPISESFSDRLLPILEEVADSVATPFHIYDEEGIVQAHRSLVSAFSNTSFKQYFAVKALPNPHILKLLLTEGSGLDCSSPVELALARQVGACGDNIMFTSNNTTLDEYEFARDLNSLVTFDDRNLIRKVEDLPQIISFRVMPSGTSTNHNLMGGATDSKFGVPEDELVDCYKECRSRGATRFGIHGMACANELNIERALLANEALFDVALNVAAATDISFEYVNLGGGLGIPYHPDEKPFDIESYAKATTAAFNQRFGRTSSRLVMECGRYITGPHGVLVSRVINRCWKGREVIGLDASMSSLMRPGFYRGAYHHITLPFAKNRRCLKCDLVGSLCENIDKFAVDRSLPEPNEGDIVLIHDTGAHGHSMGFTYNGRLRPAELSLTRQGEVLMIRRAENFDDYMATICCGVESISSKN